jgi:hypothetical protein
VTTKHSFLTCTDFICFIFFPNVNIENEHSVFLKLPKFLVWSFINLCILVCFISGYFLLVDTLNCFHQAENELIGWTGYTKLLELSLHFLIFSFFNRLSIQLFWSINSCQYVHIWCHVNIFLFVIAAASLW